MQPSKTTLNLPSLSLHLSVHLLEKFVGSGFTISSPRFQNNRVKIHRRKKWDRSRFTKVKFWLRPRFTSLSKKIGLFSLNISLNPITLAKRPFRSNSTSILVYILPKLQLTKHFWNNQFLCSTRFRSRYKPRSFKIHQA